MSVAKIKKTIDQFFAYYSVEDTVLAQALTPMNKFKVMILRTIGPDRLQWILRRDTDADIIQAWNDRTKQAYQALLTYIGNEFGNNNHQSVKVASQVTAAYLSLTGSIDKRIKNNLKRYIKIRTIPQNVSY